MLINDKDAIARLNSSGNLINRLKGGSKAGNAMSLFGINRKAEDKNSDKKEIVKTSFNPFEQEQKPKEESHSTQPQPQPEQESTKLDDIMTDSDAKVKLSLAHDKALQLLTDSVQMLSTKLDDVKADKLPAVIASASKTVESIRRERIERDKNSKDRDVHFHFYTPKQKTIEQYDIIDVAAVQTA